MGKTQSKKNARIQQLNSRYDAMGLPKSYKQMKEDSTQYSRIMTGGRTKKNNDPFSGGGDRALMEQTRLARQSLGTEGGYVSPQGIKANAHIAQQLGGAELFNTMMDASREKTSPAEYRALNGAADGNNNLTDAAKVIDEGTKHKFVEQQSDVKPIGKLLLGEDETQKILQQKAQAPKPPGLDAPKPSSSGLMGEG
jgi:hypothetical protein